MTLVRWDPLRDVEAMAERANRYFGYPLAAQSTDSREDRPGIPDWVPVVDVVETPAAYLVRVELPGLGKDDVNVSLDGHVLSIAGERKKQPQEKDTTYHRVESAYGSFLRRFALPEDVDEQRLRADSKDGVLSVHISKAEHAQPRSIEVEAA